MADPGPAPSKAEYRRNLHTLSVLGREAKEVLEGRVFQLVVSDWRDTTIESIINSRAFDERTRLQGMITLNNIDKLKDLFNTIINQGINAEKELSGKSQKLNSILV
jgi:hypothetical protein